MARGTGDRLGGSETMVVTPLASATGPWRMVRSLLVIGLALVLVSGLPMAKARAQQAPSSPTPSSLAEAWLTMLETREAPVVWSHSVALRRDTAADLQASRDRLIGELGTLVVAARAAGRADHAEAFIAWREHLAKIPAQQGRSPGRFDLPWLGADLRRDLPLDTLAYWGTCRVPDWVEAWSLAGVHRLAWRPGMRLEEALEVLPTGAVRRIDEVAVVGPLGDIERLGIAAWNHQTSRLAPGSRLMVLLPGSQGLAGALPLPVEGQASELINRRLPAYLATRLPGDTCTLEANE